MNQIIKSPINSLGYQFVPGQYLPRGKDEYYLRNRQNTTGINYRKLTAHEIEALVRNRNTSDDWNKILVSNAFNAELVQDCKFFGLVRIGKLEPYYLEFHNLRQPVGLYNSTIISCDFGDNISVSNVHYISHYIVGSEVILVNVNEIAATSTAKFGNGILKDGEQENIRIWLEVCNEAGGRKIIPFDGMLPGDAYLWTQYRSDEKLQNRFREFTEKKFDTKRGYYGLIGDRTVIKNTRIIKDVNIGSDAYVKGANKIKNVTINSSGEAKTQIGEGCELVNGIIEHGCRVFYGAKAVRFFLCSHSQLKYGARLINSYLGNNSTISCCEVLNSLIFPAHEQHHNNSFLCAASVQGQSNMAAGATIGSNHNSRSPDGELHAGRGFWPGLCVSLKHNSKFASYTMLAKGDYPAELNISIPFSLVSNDVSNDQLLVMPGYWFMYNMYALARNSWKYVDRDKRTYKPQHIESAFLAPDTINEMVEALLIIEELSGKAYLKYKGNHKKMNRQELAALGRKLLEKNDPLLGKLEIVADGFENSLRKVKLIKSAKAYHLFKELVMYYAAKLLFDMITSSRLPVKSLLAKLAVRPRLNTWVNVGGQLIPQEEIDALLRQVKSGKITGWNDVHAFYKKQEEKYPRQKLQHALAALYSVHEADVSKMPAAQLRTLFKKSVDTREWMTRGIRESRAKDYRNPFRKMVYRDEHEMDAVLGKLEDNAFIRQEMEALAEYRKAVNQIIKMKLASPAKAVRS